MVSSIGFCSAASSCLAHSSSVKGIAAGAYSSVIEGGGSASSSSVTTGGNGCTCWTQLRPTGSYSTSDCVQSLTGTWLIAPASTPAPSVTLAGSSSWLGHAAVVTRAGRRGRAEERTFGTTDAGKSA